MSGLQAEHLLSPSLPVTDINLTKLRELMHSKKGLKMFIIPCDILGVKTPIQFFISDGLTSYNECRAFIDQVRWIKERRGVDVPPDVIQSMQQLAEIAKDNEVSFVELCTYSLNYPSEGAGPGAGKKHTLEQIQKAAQDGDLGAMNELGCSLLYGLRGSKDPIKATEWLQKSADGGYPAGLWNLGKCYASGRGVKKDLTKAVELFTKASEQKHPAATYDLGTCYENGLGCAKDKAKARSLYEKAAALGDTDAKDRLKELPSQN